MYIWNHPIDLHYAVSSVVGWPRCRISVWKLTSLGSIENGEGEASGHDRQRGIEKEADWLTQCPKHLKGHQLCVPFDMDSGSTIA